MVLCLIGGGNRLHKAEKDTCGLVETIDFIDDINEIRYHIQSVADMRRAATHFCTRWTHWRLAAAEATSMFWTSQEMAHPTINEHPDRARIEFDLARGVPPRTVAKKYGVGLHACYRLLKRLPPQLRAAHVGQRLKAGADLEKLRIDESEGLLQNLATQRARLLLCQDAALEAGDAAKVAYIAGTIHRNLELVGKYLGEFAQHQITTTVSVLVSPEYLEFRSALMRALAPYPEARRAVAVALHSIEAQSAMSDQVTTAGPRNLHQLPPQISVTMEEAAHAAI
jgi:hypothetical protein